VETLRLLPAIAQSARFGTPLASALCGCLGSKSQKEKSQKEEMVENEQVAELLYQALETEKGGIQIYETALKCVVNDDLRKEWEEYLEQTRNHEQIVLAVMEKLGLDPETETPGREVVRHIGESLVKAMDMALENAQERDAAQVVACECVVLAETKDHLNWELIHEVAEKAKGEQRDALKAAYEQVEEQEDEHLYHTAGWGRELWIKALGMRAVLPPPEEEKEVKSAIGAARAKMARKRML
jgi:rubrerythrin